MTSSHSPASRFSHSFPITCAGIFVFFFSFFSPPHCCMRAIDKSSGSSSVSTWHQTEQRRCTLLISSWQKQLLAAPHSQQPLLWDPSLTHSDLWALRSTFLLLFSYSFFAAAPNPISQSSFLFLAAKCFSMKSLYLSSDDNVLLHVGSQETAFPHLVVRWRSYRNWSLLPCWPAHFAECWCRRDDTWRVAHPLVFFSPCEKTKLQQMKIILY